MKNLRRISKLLDEAESFKIKDVEDNLIDAFHDLKNMSNPSQEMLRVVENQIKFICKSRNSGEAKKRGKDFIVTCNDWLSDIQRDSETLKEFIDFAQSELNL